MEEKAELSELAKLIEWVGVKVRLRELRLSVVSI